MKILLILLLLVTKPVPSELFLQKEIFELDVQPKIKRKFGSTVLDYSLLMDSISVLCEIHLEDVYMGTQLLDIFDPKFEFDFQLGDKFVFGNLSINLNRPPQRSVLNGDFNFSTNRNDSKQYKGEIGSWVIPSLKY